MKEITDFLNANKVGAFATAEGGKARVRPFQLLWADEGRFWFCTANTKEVYAQLKAAPEAEFLSCQGMKWLRLRGKARFVQDLAVKERVLDENPMIKGIYKTASNPVFEVFCIEDGFATLCELAGRPPKTVRF